MDNRSYNVDVCYIFDFSSMAEPLSRRDFLKVTAAWTGSGLAVYGASQLKRLGFDKTFHIEMDENHKKLSFEETRDLTLYFDKMADKLPPAPKIPMTQDNMLLLAAEVMPFFVTEGATDRAVYPDKLQPIIYTDERHATVLGQSNCNDKAVATFRYANPFSLMYGDLDWIGTEIHELAHVQQRPEVCMVEPSENIENTAQIVSWEVMSALINGGNGLYLYPLLDDLKGRMLGANLATAMREKRMDEWEKLAKHVNPTQIDRARREKSKRFWAGREHERMTILEKYGLNPMSRVVEAIKKGESIKGLALPMDTNGRYQPIERLFKVDDLAYTIKNLGAIVTAYGKTQVRINP